MLAKIILLGKSDKLKAIFDATRRQIEGGGGGVVNSNCGGKAIMGSDKPLTNRCKLSIQGERDAMQVQENLMHLLTKMRDALPQKCEPSNWPYSFQCRAAARDILKWQRRPSIRI
jgi:hypothetical protein